MDGGDTAEGGMIMRDSFCSWVKERDDTIVVTGVEGEGIEKSLNVIPRL